MCYSTSVLIKPTWRLHQSLEVFFVGPTKNNFRKQQLSYTREWEEGWNEYLDSIQSCAIAAPSDPWHLNLLLGVWVIVIFFFIKIICWTPCISQFFALGSLYFFLEHSHGFDTRWQKCEVHENHVLFFKCWQNVHYSLPCKLIISPKIALKDTQKLKKG